MKRIVLLGGNGQLGWELRRSLAPLAEVVALERGSSSMSTPRAAADLPPPCGDLRRPDALATAIRKLRPDVVVNAAAYTAVDRAESEPAVAASLNATAPGVLARVGAEIGALLVHFSTDFVFDGSGDRAWAEEDRAAPLNVYGHTKLDGEELVRASGCRHLILRAGWLHAPRGVNFPSTMLRLASERRELQVVDDRFGAPTGTDLVADVTAQVLRTLASRPELVGTYHVAAAGAASLFEYARDVIERARARGWPLRTSSSCIVPVPSSAFPTAARRPLNCRLDCRKLERAFGMRMPPWQDGVDRLVAELSDHAADGRGYVSPGDRRGPRSAAERDSA